jgi:transforming acidic coiled-coil-containing protein 3
MSCILSELFSPSPFYYRKYEKSKVVIEGFRKNEEVLRASLAEYEATIRKQEQKYDMLKSHAMAQLERYVITFSNCHQWSEVY